MSKHKKQKKHFLRTRNVFIIILIILLSCVISFLIYRINNPNTEKILKPQEAVEKADDLSAKKNYNEAITILDNSLKNTDNATEKSMILQQKANLLMKKNDSTNAVNVAKDAYQLEKTVSSASVVGSVARKTGDIDTAKKYYQIALDLENKSPNPFGTSDSDYLKSILKDLGNGN